MNVDTLRASEEDDFARGASFLTFPPADAEKIQLHPPGRTKLTADAAIELIALAKSARDELGTLIWKLYEGGAHLVLGYTNFGLFCEERLGLDARAGYRHLEVSQLRQILSVKFVTDTSGIADSAIAKLAPLKDVPSQMVDALDDATHDARRHGRETPTGRDVARAVKKRIAATQEPVAIATVHESDPSTPAPEFNEPTLIRAPETPQVNVLDSIAVVMRAIEASEPEAARNAARAALRVLDRRWRGTAPETLAKCVDMLLRVIARNEA